MEIRGADTNRKASLKKNAAEKSRPEGRLDNIRQTSEEIVNLTSSPEQPASRVRQAQPEQPELVPERQPVPEPWVLPEQRPSVLFSHTR
jgi:hypothetical protein